MAKKTPEKAKVTEKKIFDVNQFKVDNGFIEPVIKKEISWIPMSEAFYEALKIPGIPRGFFSSFRGYSNTGKSTAIYEAVVGAQKIGDFPIIFETEGNWNWEHAKNIGMEFEEVYDEDTGEIIDYTGNFLFFDGDKLLKWFGNYDYSASKEGSKKLRDEPVIEDIPRAMNYFLKKQEDGEFPFNILFTWDSVGSLDCFKSVMSNSSNNQWNAGAMEQAFKSMVMHKIPSSQNVTKEFTNTFAVVQKIWMDNENKVIKHKGGECFFYGPRLIIHYGGILSHSTAKLKATSGGETYQFGIETKVRCEKNQVNGIEETGVIASTPHGYWNPKKIEEYKKKHRDYILQRLNTPLDDFNIITEGSVNLDD